MPYEHQTLPPGPYIIRVDKWAHEKQGSTGRKFMMYDVYIVGTNLRLPYYISEAQDWRELIPHEKPQWLNLMAALAGRYFIVNIGRINISPSRADSYQNNLSFPIVEVFDPEEPGARCIPATIRAALS